MKKLSLLLVSVALFSFVSINSCKQAPKQEESTIEEAEEPVEEVADTVESVVEQVVE